LYVRFRIVNSVTVANTGTFVIAANFVARKEPEQELFSFTSNESLLVLF
jgi:hypothetical protein